MKSIHKSTTQQGYVLLMSLVFLIILTALALAEVSLNSTQTRIATNATDTEISFEKAEGALNQASNYLLRGTYKASDFLQNSNGLYVFNPNNAPLWTTINWSSTTAVIQSFQGNSGPQAKYIIEQLPSVIKPGSNMKKPLRIYRITTRSAGASGSSAVLLQSTIQIQD